MSQRPVTRAPLPTGFHPSGSVSDAGLSRAIAKPLLVCFSHLRWNFVWQRPQHVLTRASKDFRVAVFEEPEYRPGVIPHLEVTSVGSDLRTVVPVLPDPCTELQATMAQRQLLERFILGERSTRRVFWYYTPMAMGFSSHLPADLVVYDNMDELSAFSGASPELVANEQELLARADIVFTGGMSLYEAKRHRHPRVHAFPSSIEFDHFVKARALRGAEPADQASIPHPRIGFFGVIDERMDTSLVADAARMRPDWQFVMIGPVVKIDAADLPKAPNIHWLGSKLYADLPSYLAGWDVGMMPFALNESTRFISPTKTPEFLAAGLPVVSTAITDVVRPYGQKGLVEIARDATDFVSKVAGLMTRPKMPWLSKVDRHLAAGSWDQTWADMRDLVLDGMGEVGGRRAASDERTGKRTGAVLPAE